MNKSKNDKKGFTLIELLAVIVILAIIALIATPIILNVISRAKKSAAVDSAYGYIEAIEYQNQMNSLDNTKYSKIETGDVTSLNSKVNVKGTKPDSGNIVIENNKVVSATLCINGYKAVYQNNKVEIASDSSECRSSNSNQEASGNSEQICNENPKNLNVWLKDVTGGKELCIKVNGQDECFKYNDYANEKTHMETLIGNCQTNPMGPNQSITVCEGEDYTCYTQSTNQVYCIAHINNAPYCTLSDSTSSCDVQKPIAYRIQNEYDSTEKYTILNENLYNNVRTVEKSDGTKGVCIKYITNKWECFYDDDYNASKTLMQNVFAQHDDSNDPSPTECSEETMDWGDHETIYGCNIWIPYPGGGVTYYGCSMNKNDDGTASNIYCGSPHDSDNGSSECRDSLVPFGDGQGNNWYSYCFDVGPEYETIPSSDNCN